MLRIVSSASACARSRIAICGGIYGKGGLRFSRARKHGRFLSTSATEDYRDEELRMAFDSREFGRELVHGKKEATGLFGNSYLSSPQGITLFANESLAKAKQLVQEIITAKSNGDLRFTIRNLDILSDTLCKVIDMVAFVRMSHPNSKFLDAAQSAHELLFEYMNVLNTSVEMEQILERVLNDPSIRNELSEEEVAVGRILLADFKRSGVQLPQESRAEFIEISNNVSILGQQFITQVAPKKDYVTFSSSDVYGMDPMLARKHSRFGKVRIPTAGPVSTVAMRTIANPNVRQEIWLAQRDSSQQQEQYLKTFLQQRARLAQIMGHDSFAGYELELRMMKTPENVTRFLEQLANKVYPRAQKELECLQQLKRQDGGVGELKAWDHEYYAARYLQKRRSKTYAPDSLSAYFSLGTVMQGISRLFSHIYGIKFVPKETMNGEVWHDDVRRLDVVSETDGVIGTMYCDLFEREGKSPNPAHFTVQCSRKVLPNEQEYGSSDSEFYITNKNGDIYQKPIIALVCDFAPSYDSQCLLDFGQVETLFHEMGHAIHSMIGRTELHNVSGTRCASDFVELPSVLMERFAADPQVLGLYARHYKTGEPLPYQLLQSHLSVQATFKNSEVYNQIKLSLLDQEMHSSAANRSDFNPHDVYYKLEKSHALYDEPHPDSKWHLFFTHLFGYAATYYCYLFDRAIADQIWNTVFVQDPISRSAGELYKNEVLAWGGSRDPWSCVAGVLNKPELKSGNEQAINEIGNGIDL